MRVMILNDGETFTNLEGCMIVDITVETQFPTDVEDPLDLIDIDYEVKAAYENFKHNRTLGRSTAIDEETEVHVAHECIARF